MEIVKNTTQELTLVYRPWKSRLERLLAPVSLIFCLAIIYFCLVNQFSYKWIILFIATWGCIGSCLVTADICRDDIWTFDTQKRTITHFQRRPGYCNVLPRVPLLFPAVGIVQIYDLNVMASVTIQEKTLYDRKWIRVVIMTNKRQQVHLIKHYSPATEDEHQRQLKVVEAIKTKLHTEIV